jgi:hypothetical protein
MLLSRVADIDGSLMMNRQDFRGCNEDRGTLMVILD